MKKIILSLIIGILVVSYASSTQHVDYSNPNELGSADIVDGINNGYIDPIELETAKLDQALTTDPGLWNNPMVQDAIDVKLDWDSAFLSEENLGKWFNQKGGFVSVTGTSLTDYNKGTGAVILRETGIKISGMDPNKFLGAKIVNGIIIFPDQTTVDDGAIVTADSEQLNIEGGRLRVSDTLDLESKYYVKQGTVEINGVDYTADGPMKVERGVLGPVVSSLPIVTIDDIEILSKITGMRDGFVVDKFTGAVEFGNGYKIINPGTFYNPHTADGQSLATIQPVEILNYVPTGGNRGACLNACILEEGLELHARANTEAIITVLETDKMNYFQSDPLIAGRIILRSVNDDEGFGVFTLTGSRHELEPGYTISGEFPNINIDVAYFNDEGFQKFFYDAPNNDISISYPALDPALLPPTPPGLEVVGNTYVVHTAEPEADVYTVQPGDSLLKIARDLRERGYSVTAEQLIEANKDKYPRLEYDPDHIEIGWTFDIPGAPTDATTLLAHYSTQGTFTWRGTENARTLNVRTCDNTRCNRVDSLDQGEYSFDGMRVNSDGEVWFHLPDIGKYGAWAYGDGIITRKEFVCTMGCDNMDFGEPNLVASLPTQEEVVEDQPPLIQEYAELPEEAAIIQAAFFIPEPSTVRTFAQFNPNFVAFIESGHETSPFGFREDPINGKQNVFHPGIDQGGYAIGTPIPNPMPGAYVKEADFDALNGGKVVMEGEFPIGLVEFRIAHMDKIYVTPGQIMDNPDSYIGTIGDKGRTTGPNAHIVCKINGRTVNPHSCPFMSTR